MSKTSSRRARKRKLKDQRMVRPGWAEADRLRDELERVSAVLADLIEEQKGAAVPAREVVAWVKNPELVRAVFDGSDDFYDCPHCDVQRGGAHYRTCVLAMAWRATGHKYAEQDLVRAHSEAWQENNRRAVGTRTRMTGPLAGAVHIRGLYSDPDQLRGFQDRQLMVTPRDLPRLEEVDHRVGFHFHGISVVTSDLVRPGEAYLMNPDFPIRLNKRGNVVPPRTVEGRMEQARQVADLADLFPADYLRFISSPDLGEATPFQREYLGEWPDALDNSANPSTGPDYERWVSDNRGLDVVEAEARAHHIDLMLNRIGFPQS